MQRHAISPAPIGSSPDEFGAKMVAQGKISA